MWSQMTTPFLGFKPPRTIRVRENITARFFRCWGYSRLLSLVFPFTFYKQAGRLLFFLCSCWGNTSDKRFVGLLACAMNTCQQPELYFRERERITFCFEVSTESLCVRYTFSIKCDRVILSVDFVDFSRERNVYYR